MRERLQEIYKEETVNKVRVGGKVKKGLWTAKRVRQGCSLRTKLFALLIANLDDRLKRREKGGIELEGKRLFRLAYTDIVLLARDGKERKFMMGN